MIPDLMWECTCGHLEYGDIAPEECPDCYSINSFVQLPEEIVAERERDLAEKMLEEQAESGLIPKTLKKSPKKKSIKRKLRK